MSKVIFNWLIGSVLSCLIATHGYATTVTSQHFDPKTKKICKVAKEGDLETLEAFLTQDYIEKISLQDLNHAVFCASKFKQDKALSFLLANPVVVNKLAQNKFDKRKFNPFDYALGWIVRNGSFEAFKLLINHEVISRFFTCYIIGNKIINIFDHIFATAAKYGRLDIVTFLIKHKSRFLFKGNRRKGINGGLLEASKGGHHHIVRYLLKNDFFQETILKNKFAQRKLNVLDEALGWAAFNGHEDIVEDLATDSVLTVLYTRHEEQVEHSRFKKINDTWRSTTEEFVQTLCAYNQAFAWAACNGHVGIMKSLIAKDEIRKLIVKGDEHDGIIGALLKAIHHGQLKVVEFLLTDPFICKFIRIRDVKGAYATAHFHEKYEICKFLAKVIRYQSYCHQRR